MKDSGAFFAFALLAFCAVSIAPVFADGNDTAPTEVPSSTPVPSQIPATAAPGCAGKMSCSDCSKDNGCVWCVDDQPNTNGTCVNAKFYGLGNSKCKDWRWKQCAVPGKYAAIAAGGLVGLLCLCCLGCVCRCLCCSRKKRNVKNFAEFKTLRSHSDREEEEGLISGAPTRTPKTDSRRAELMRKYGSPAAQPIN